MDKAEWIKRFVEAWMGKDPDPEDVDPAMVAEVAQRVWSTRGHEDPRDVAPDEWTRDGGGSSCAQ